jgi:hypothetical protein
VGNVELVRVRVGVLGLLERLDSPVSVLVECLTDKSPDQVMRDCTHRRVELILGSSGRGLLLLNYRGSSGLGSLLCGPLSLLLSLLELTTRQLSPLVLKV